MLYSLIQTSMQQEPVNLLRVAEKPVLEPLEKRPVRIGRILLFCAVIFVATSSLAFGVHQFIEYRNARQEATYSTILQPKQFGFLQKIKTFFFGPDHVLKGTENDRINILLLGMGGIGHDGPYLSDTNIIASIKPSTNEVAMISIPRDLSVRIPNYGLRKINHVNAFAENEHPGQGGEYTKQFFSETFGIPIDYYVRVDFKAFQDIVDLVGGVTVDVPRDFTDYTFPGPNNSYRVVSFKAGKQTLNGEWALIYSRSRHGGNGEGSDFARARRQQQVISAFKEKLLSFGTYTNPVTVKKMIDAVAKNVQTNLEIKDIMTLASMAKNVDNNFKTLVLDDRPGGFLVSAAQASLIPRTGNFTAINTAIATVFNPTSSIPALATIQPLSENTPVFSGARIEVQNGTWHAGFATRIKKRLQDIGLSVETIGNSVKRPIDTTTIYVLKPLPNDILSLLSKELRAVSTTTLPTWLVSPTSSEGGLPFNPDSEIVIILGNDLQNQFSLN